MTPEERQAIRDRSEAATEGPWLLRGQWIDGGPNQYDEVIAPAPVECMAYCYGGSSAIEISDVDREFIAHARTDIPALLDALDEAEKRLAGLPWSVTVTPGVQALSSDHTTTTEADPNGPRPMLMRFDCVGGHHFTGYVTKVQRGCLMCGAKDDA